MPRERNIGPGAVWRHPRRIWGLPLVAVARGRDARTGRRCVARGFFAVGQVAVGVVAVGQLAVGLVCVGQLALGVLTAVGQGTLGFVAGGQLAAGIVAAAGQLAEGTMAAGQLAAGLVVVGGKTAVLPPAVLLLTLAVPFMLSGYVVKRWHSGRLRRWGPLFADGAEKEGEEREERFMGTVATESPLTTPLGGHACAWYRVRTVYQRNGRTLDEEVAGDELVVQGEQERARVLLKDARCWVRSAWIPVHKVAPWLEDHPRTWVQAGAVAPLVAEEWLPVGAAVVVSGAAHLEPDPGGEDQLYRQSGLRRCFSSTEATPLLVTTEPLDELEAELRLGPRIGMVQLIIGGILAQLAVLVGLVL